MKYLMLAMGLCALALASGCSQSEGKTRTHHNVVELAAKAKGEVHVIGTLATLGSFEWDAAPLKTHAAADLYSIPQALHDHKLTADQAQAKIDRVDHAHDLIQNALKVCRQNDQTGKCTGNEAQARALLEQAKAELVAAEAN